jgi:hypothetical protein
MNRRSSTIYFHFWPFRDDLTYPQMAVHRHKQNCVLNHAPACSGPRGRCVAAVKILRNESLRMINAIQEEAGHPRSASDFLYLRRVHWVHQKRAENRNFKKIEIEMRGTELSEGLEFLSPSHWACNQNKQKKKD